MFVCIDICTVIQYIGMYVPTYLPTYKPNFGYVIKHVCLYPLIIHLLKLPKTQLIIFYKIYKLKNIKHSKRSTSLIFVNLLNESLLYIYNI